MKRKETVYNLSKESKEYLEHFSLVSEIVFSPDNAVEIDYHFSVLTGDFTVGDVTYKFDISKMKYLEDLFPDVEFKSSDVWDISFAEKNKLGKYVPNRGKQNLIKIYSTLYKIILKFIETVNPDYILLTAVSGSNYLPIYNQLVKTNKLPGYHKKTVASFDGGDTIIIVKSQLQN